MIVAYYRGYVCKIPQTRGGMAAVGMGKEDVARYLVSGVHIACENSGSSVTISGDLDTLENIISIIKAQRPDVLARKLQVEMAYHSSEYFHPLISTFFKAYRGHGTPGRPLQQIDRETPVTSISKDSVLFKRENEGPSESF